MHALLPTALSCLSYSEDDRPSAQELCQQLATVKGTPRYTQSEQQVLNIRELQQQLEAGDKHIHSLEQQLQTKDQQLQDSQRQLQDSQRQLQDNCRIVSGRCTPYSRSYRVVRNRTSNSHVKWKRNSTRLKIESNSYDR